MKKLSASLWITAMIITGCSSNEPDVKQDTVHVPDFVEADISLSEKNMIVKTNNFAYKFFDVAIAEMAGENFVISPLSAECNMGLVANATTADTRKQFLSALGFSDIMTLNTLNAKLTRTLPELDPNKVKVSIANSLWTSQNNNVTCVDNFKKVASEYYLADMYQFHYSPETYKELNQWAYDKTDGLVKDFYKSNEIEESTAIVLMNAVYFKGIFTKGFDKTRTKDATFTSLDNSKSTVHMMYGEQTVQHYSDNSIDAIALTFGNGTYEMIVAMPKDGISLTSAASSAINIDKGTKSPMTIGIPKFNIATELHFDNLYQSLGITPKGDFSAVLCGSNSISHAAFKTKQKTIIGIDEEGVEAAAVTGTTTDIMVGGESFVANRPFVYIIRDKEYGAILFMGAYVK